MSSEKEYRFYFYRKNADGQPLPFVIQRKTHDNWNKPFSVYTIWHSNGMNDGEKLGMANSMKEAMIFLFETAFLNDYGKVYTNSLDSEEDRAIYAKLLEESGIEEAKEETIG